MTTRSRFSAKDVCLAQALVLAALSCTEAEPPTDDGWSGTVDTLPGGHVIVRNPDRPLAENGMAFDVHERFRLGSIQGDRADVFGRVRDLELDAVGNVYVLDAQASEVRVFDQFGAHLISFGRPGEGPGELKRPAGIMLSRDGRVWVMNWGNARYTAFDPTGGEAVEERRRHASYAMFPWPGSFDRSGRLLDVGLWGEGGPHAGEPAVLRLDSGWAPADTLALPQPDERYRIYFRRGGVPTMSTVDPFAPRPFWAPDPAGGIVVGEGSRYRLHRIRFGFDTTMTIEVLRDPEPVSAAERDSALDAFRERTAAAGDARPDREVRVPATKPAHGDLFVDDRDRIWVRRPEAPRGGAAWDVIGPDGRLLGRVTVPLGFASASVRDARLALAGEPDGIPTVIVYDLTPASER